MPNIEVNGYLVKKLLSTHGYLVKELLSMHA